MEALPVRDRTELGTGGCTGKGRGSQHSGNLACFVTPPSKTVNGGDGRAENHVAKVKQSEGRMPDDRDGCRMSMGRVSMEVTMDDVSKPSVDGLQRALEVEVVNQLRVQNSQLMEEIEKLKTMMSQSGKGSSGSWSELGGSACAGAPRVRHLKLMMEDVDMAGITHQGVLLVPLSRGSGMSGSLRMELGSLTERPQVARLLMLNHVMYLNLLLHDLLFLLFLNLSW